MAASVPEVSLHSCSGRSMPVIGMGTMAYPLVDSETAKEAILEAIRAGYRHFDTAFGYGSEKPLGEAVVEALRLGLVKSREELFITTKLWCTFAEKDSIVPSIKMSLSNLQMEYVDLYLIHWSVRLSKDVLRMPAGRDQIFELDIKSVWEGMEECHDLGLAKAIGVSNFSTKKLELLLSSARIPPAVNQVEMNPMWQQKQLREYCSAKGIHITAYSPLGAPTTKWGDGRILECDVLEEIARARGKTIAQVSLRWVYEQKVSLVGKSFNKQRMRENLGIFDWSLTEEESMRISQLPQKKGVSFAKIFGPHDICFELDAEI
ncbi:hypothetical protein SAY87_015856 [Trapa incisa]|uniref:NADP-dependent oxidoreductase domain-containing protein n=1 Tax=Trapa incisa TaxID=236973 RepID=A0AAN7QXJ6_9MYRT|nr:hypothetical protein SAY87_015856 [Trapa incisa]